MSETPPRQDFVEALMGALRVEDSTRRAVEEGVQKLTRAAERRAEAMAAAGEKLNVTLDAAADAIEHGEFSRLPDLARDAFAALGDIVDEPVEPVAGEAAAEPAPATSDVRRSPEDVAAALRALTGLRGDGLVDEAAFEAKRAALLAEL